MNISFNKKAPNRRLCTPAEASSSSEVSCFDIFCIAPFSRGKVKCRVSSPTGRMGHQGPLTVRLFIYCVHDDRFSYNMRSIRRYQVLKKDCLIKSRENPLQDEKIKCKVIYKTNNSVFLTTNSLI